MELTLVIIGFILSLLGFVGAILPILPGPPLGYIALLVLSYAREWTVFSVTFLVVAGILTLAVSVMDWLIPPVGARRYGASKFGLWGSLAGMALGLLFFSFPGMIIGGWVGAVGGEFFAGKTAKSAVRAGWGALLGQILSIGLKMAFSGALLLIYVRQVFWG